MTHKERNSLVARLSRIYRNRCAYCEADLHAATASIDHFVPPKRGGDSSAANLVICCPACNQSKRDYWSQEEDKKVLHPYFDTYRGHICLGPDGQLVGSTLRGSTTINVLSLNRASSVDLRVRRHHWSAHLNNLLLDLRSGVREDLPARGSGQNNKTAISSIAESFVQMEGTDVFSRRHSLSDQVDIREVSVELIDKVWIRAETLDDIDCYTAECLVAELFAARGYSVRLIGRNKQIGADVIAVAKQVEDDEDVAHLIEVKWRKDKVGIEEIDRLIGATVRYRNRNATSAHSAVVSLAGFKKLQATDDAELEQLDVELYDRDALKSWVQEYRPHPSNGLWTPSHWTTNFGTQIDQDP